MSLASHLAELERKHRALDAEIMQEQQFPQHDPAKMKNLKRQKLQLKDEIVRVQVKIT
ncbi:MAG: YdcH family protein, partial [Bosea sp. (in: a-proteobacteria)]